MSTVLAGRAGNRPTLGERTGLDVALVDQAVKGTVATYLRAVESLCEEPGDIAVSGITDGGGRSGSGRPLRCEPTASSGRCRRRLSGNRTRIGEANSRATAEGWPGSAETCWSGPLRVATDWVPAVTARIDAVAALVAQVVAGLLQRGSQEQTSTPAAGAGRASPRAPVWRSSKRRSRPSLTIARPQGPADGAFLLVVGLPMRYRSRQRPPSVTHRQA
jgi:hypothetical protein